MWKKCFSGQGNVWAGWCWAAIVNAVQKSISIELHQIDKKEHNTMGKHSIPMEWKRHS